MHRTYNLFPTTADNCPGCINGRAHSGNAWVLPPVEPPAPQPSSSAPISFAKIQQLQSQPNTVVEQRRSLRDIQAEEAELQAEVEFMKWWTAEEERIRLENEAIAASLVQSQQQQQHRHGRRSRKSATTAEGESAAGPRAPHGGERRQQVAQRVPSEKGSRRA